MCHLLGVVVVVRRLLLLRLLLLRLMMVMMLRRLLLRRRWLVLRLMLVLLLLLQSQWSTVVCRMRQRRQRSMGIVTTMNTVTGVRHCVGGRHIAVQTRGLTIDRRSTLAGDNFCHHNLSS